MELYFLGRGGAFFTEEGNTSAFFIEKNVMFLIDCGELVFKKIKESHILDYAHIEEVYVFITHMHTDHTGSLSTLIQFCKYNNFKEIDINVVCADPIKESLVDPLESTGCLPLFKFVTTQELRDRFKCFSEVRYLSTVHKPGYPAYSILFETSTGRVFYSGDTQDISAVRELIACESPKVERIYLEAISERFPNNVHLPIDEIAETIPQELRSRVYLMHFNNYECIKKAKQLGFQVVEVIK